MAYMAGEANTKCSSTWHKRAGSQREVLYAMGGETREVQCTKTTVGLPKMGGKEKKATVSHKKALGIPTTPSVPDAK